jgi:hypothetical protein
MLDKLIQSEKEKRVGQAKDRVKEIYSEILATGILAVAVVISIVSAILL